MTMSVQAAPEQTKAKTPQMVMTYPPHSISPGRARFNHVSLRVSDLEQSINFYRDFLGFRLIRTQELGFFRAAFISTGDAEPIIELMQHRKHEPEKIGLDSGHIGIFVDDVDAVFAKLSEAGQKIAIKPVRPGVGAPYFGFALDPDGYRIEVMENPAPTDCMTCHRTPHLDSPQP